MAQMREQQHNGEDQQDDAGNHARNHVEKHGGDKKAGAPALKGEHRRFAKPPDRL